MELTIIAGAVLLATVIEGLVEYLFGEVDAVKPYLKYVALAFGIVAAFAYNLDLLAYLGMSAAFPFVGNVISGLIIGRGSNYVNDIISAFKK